MQPGPKKVKKTKAKAINPKAKAKADTLKSKNPEDEPEEFEEDGLEHADEPKEPKKKGGRPRKNFATASNSPKKDEGKKQHGSTKTTSKAAVEDKEEKPKRPFKETALRSEWSKFRKDYVDKNKGSGKRIQDLIKEAAEQSPPHLRVHPTCFLIRNLHLDPPSISWKLITKASHPGAVPQTTTPQEF